MLDKKPPVHGKTGKNFGQRVVIVTRPDLFKDHPSGVKAVKTIALARHLSPSLPGGSVVYVTVTNHHPVLS